jgi:uncharacterized protein YcbK (DUF882 family)
MGDISRNFNKSEVSCPDCRLFIENLDHISRRQLMRDIYGKPMRVTSSTRCRKHNEEVGGKDTSSHLKGVADDISASDGGEIFLLVKAAMDAGFKRIGIAKTFVHVDSDDSKPDWIWTY